MQQKNKNKRSWFLVLFGMPFAGVAIGMLGFAIIPSIQEYLAMQNWHPVQAKVISHRLETHQGDDSTTYSATGRYRYHYKGSDYHGDRLGIHGGSDNIGDWHHDMDRRLAYAQNKQHFITVYVNPQNPAEAVVDRELRIAKMMFYSLFVVVFGIAGVGIMVWGWRQRSEETGVVDPKQPWLSQKSWASPQITAEQGGATWVSWGFAIIWCALSAPANFVIVEEVNKGNWGILAILLFDIVGIGLVIAAIRQTLSAKRFGNTLLTLDPFPGRIAGQVGGKIDAKVPYDPQLAFKLKLSCTRTYVSGSGKNRSTNHQILWQDERWFHAESDMQGMSDLWFCFDVPDNLPVSEPASSDYRHWRLQAEADLPGVDFERSWEVPVFDIGPEKSRKAEQRSHPSHEETQQAVSQLMNLKHISGGIELDFPGGRHWIGGLMLLVIGAVFTGVAVAIGRSPHGMGEWMITLVSGLLGPSLMLLGIWMAGNRLMVRVDHASVQVRYKLLGVPIYQQQVPINECRFIEVKRGARMQSGNDITQFYDLKLLTNTDKRITIGDGFKGQSQALHAAREIARLTKLEMFENR